MDYASLTLQIQNYSNRTDDFFIAQIPDFINQAITRIYSEARSIGFQKIFNTGSFVVGTARIPKPADWKETISLSYTTPDGIKYVLPRTYEFCILYSPNPTITGDPTFYSDYSMPQVTDGPGQFYLALTPATAHRYELIYLSLPLFNAENPVNFLTDRYPSLLLYASLFESIPLLKDDERISTFEALYNRALKDILSDTKERYTDRTSKRDKD